MKLIIFILMSFFSLNIFSENYQSVFNISYRESNDSYALSRCRLDFYYPQNKENYVTVVWIHGGGLTDGSKFIPDELTNSGIAVVAVEYRLMPKVGLKECLDDVALAIAWVFKHVESYGGNRAKIVISGHSAGGYLTNMVGLDKKWLEKYEIDADSIALLCPFSGHAITHFAYRREKGIKSTQPSIDEYAPFSYVRADAPPLVIISGDRNLELLGRYEETAYFWRMMKESGHKNTYIYELDGYDHVEMQHPAFYILKKHIKDLF